MGSLLILVSRYPSTSRMLSKKLTIKDLELIDTEFYNSLIWIRFEEIFQYGIFLKPVLHILVN